MERRRGSTLGTTLILAALVMLLLFTMAGVSVNHLNVGSRLDNGQHARNLAEAAIQKAIEELYLTDAKDTIKSKTFTATFPDSPDGAIGLLTFDATEAAKRSIPISTYNVGKDNGTKGYRDRIVPRQSVHLVGIGRCNGVERGVEAIIHIPTWKYAVCSAGNMTLNGPSVIAGANDKTDLPALSELDDKLDQLEPGHINSNSNAQLNGLINVTGLARAAGTITKTGTPGPEVLGGIRENNGSNPIPDLKPEDFDPANIGKTWLGRLAPDNSRWKCAGLVKRAGDLTIDKLELPDGSKGVGAIVMLQGNLTVNRIVGTGAVVTTGNLIIREASTVIGENSVALLSGKDLEIHGAIGPDSTRVNGVAYSRGSLKLDKVTFMGAAVMAGDGPGNSMDVQNANVIANEDMIDFQLHIPFGPDAGGGEYRVVLSKDAEEYFDHDNDTFYKADGTTLFKPPVKTDFQFVDKEDSEIPLDTVADNFLTSKPGWERICFRAGPPLEEYPNATETTWDQVFAKFGVAPGPPEQRMKAFLVDHLFGGRYLPDAIADLKKIAAWYARSRQEDGTFSFDPNRFLSFDSAARIVLWKDL